LNLQSAIGNLQFLYACLYRPPSPDGSDGKNRGEIFSLVEIAQEFSPRYERHRDDLVSVDISGLTRLLGSAQAIGEEMRREAAARGVRAHVAIACTRMTALLLAQARPGLTIVAPGDEASALAPLTIGILEKIGDDSDVRPARLKGSPSKEEPKGSSFRAGPKDSSFREEPKGSPFREEREAFSRASLAGLAFQKWGLKTLGELAALPSADLMARLGRPARAWQAIARGEDIRPLVPMLEDERFEASLDLEWPIADLEPLSFVFTRLLEPLSTRLERRDRGAAVLHILLRLVTRDSTSIERETSVRRLELPTPMREVRALRTLALLDLEAHPVEAAIDRVTIVIDPTPGRVVQHTLYTRAQPTPEQLSTLLARLGALMGQDRFGAPVSVDTERPGAFAMAPFATDHDGKNRNHEPSRLRSSETPPSFGEARQSAEGAAAAALSPQSCENAPPLVSALRRCRQPVPARVTVADGRPVRVTTDRRGFTGGAVKQCAGPWRTSGAWWAGGAGGAGKAGEVGRAGEAGRENFDRSVPPVQPIPPVQPWNRDEWDVALNDRAVYRVFRDRDADRWFIDAVVD
jgi:protein ImuB